MENGRYYVDGEKFYSTGSSFAHWLAIKAIHPEEYVVLTLVDATAQGVEVIDNWNGFGQRTTSSGTVKLQRVEVDPLLIFDERKLAEDVNYRGAFSQLMQVAIDVGIAEAAFEDTLSAVKKPAQLSMRKLRKPVLNITPYKKSANLQCCWMPLSYCSMKLLNI